MDHRRLGRVVLRPEAFRRATGREYAFSRDVDLGFHVEPGWGEQEVPESSLARTSRELIEKMDLKGQSFRLYREFHTETGEPLAAHDAARLARHARMRPAASWTLRGGCYRAHRKASEAPIRNPRVFRVCPSSFLSGYTKNESRPPRRTRQLPLPPSPRGRNSSSSRMASWLLKLWPSLSVPTLSMPRYSTSTICPSLPRCRAT